MYILFCVGVKGLKKCRSEMTAMNNAWGKVIHPKYYKHLKKGAHQSHLGRQKMGWFLADQVRLKYGTK
jgi:hypothetical protein